MNQCKTGCEAEAEDGAGLCATHWDEWLTSREHARWVQVPVVVSSAAFMDFITRIRLERQNGAPPCT